MIIKPNECIGCPLHAGQYGKPYGYVPASGTGDNGVLIILEAAGEEEEIIGAPVLGRAGQFMWQHLKPLGIEREGFRIHNVLSCRPPENKLLKMAYTDSAIEHCRPNLERTILDHVAHCQAIGLTPVIISLGKFSFKWLMGIDSDTHPILREDYQTYPFWLEKWGVWMLAAPHPSHIMQGKNNLIPTMQFVFERALEIARDGLTLEVPEYLLDPDPIQFNEWIDGYFEALKADPENTYLSYDIETPYKSGKAEDEVAREDDDDYIILRCGYSYNLQDGTTRGCSALWQPDWLRGHERLFSTSGQNQRFGVNWNGSGYDDVRIRQQLSLNLVTLDAMLAWHVLNTSLPKALGFVTPFYVKNTSMWKHLATPPKEWDQEAKMKQEAFYNAKDADMALRNWLCIKNDLKQHNLWDVFDRHVVQLNEVLSYMSGQGVLLDKVARQSAEAQLALILTNIWDKMQSVIPIEAKTLKIYKKEPDDYRKQAMGMVEVDSERMAKQCPRCLAIDVRADHFRSVGPKRLGQCAVCGVSAKRHAGLSDHDFKPNTDNPCYGLRPVSATVPTTYWAEPQPFKISKTSLTRYQEIKKHKPFKDRKTKRVTFDIKAIKGLIAKYPEDELYPIIGEFRKVQKLASTYVGVTQYKEVVVEDDYVLKPGEKWKDDLEQQSLSDNLLIDSGELCQ